MWGTGRMELRLQLCLVAFAQMLLPIFDRVIFPFLARNKIYPSPLMRMVFGMALTGIYKGEAISGGELVAMSQQQLLQQCIPGNPLPSGEVGLDCCACVM